MENQPINIMRKTIQLALVSLITGIVSILPYLMLVINMLLSDVWAGIWIPTPCGYTLNGIVFGLISLVTGSLAIRQIKNNQGLEADHRLAIIGRVLGILGIIANIIFYVAFLLVVMRD
jgi:hypothetical protein